MHFALSTEIRIKLQGQGFPMAKILNLALKSLPGLNPLPKDTGFKIDGVKPCHSFFYLSSFLISFLV